MDMHFVEGRQDYHFTMVETDYPVPLRARIRIDSYAPQSYAVGEMFTAENGWVKVVEDVPNVPEHAHQAAYGAPHPAGRDDEAKRTFAAVKARDILGRVRIIVDKVC